MGEGGADKYDVVFFTPFLHTARAKTEPEFDVEIGGEREMRMGPLDAHNDARLVTTKEAHQKCAAWRTLTWLGWRRQNQPAMWPATRVRAEFWCLCA